MQVLTTECVTGVEVSVRVPSTRSEARLLQQTECDRVTQGGDGALVFGTLWLHQSADEFDRAAVLENGDHTPAQARRRKRGMNPRSMPLSQSIAETMNILKTSPGDRHSCGTRQADMFRRARPSL
jgi:hypothetical protein